MAAVLLNTGVAFRTSPRVDSGSGVKASPVPRSFGAWAPGLPSAPFTEHGLPGLLKEMPPALKSLPASSGQSWTSLCREGGWGLITTGRALMFIPQGRGSTLKASGGKTSLWGAPTRMGGDVDNQALPPRARWAAACSQMPRAQPAIMQMCPPGS